MVTKQNPDTTNTRINTFRKISSNMMFLLTLLLAPITQAFEHTHDTWSTLLQKNVSYANKPHATVVNYSGFKQQEVQLDNYLSTLSNVTYANFNTWPKDAQLAFLINAYNAWTIKFILSKWPDIESIKELGSFFSSPWKKKFIPLLGKKRSLDNIEHDLIRGSQRYGDPRIHFAVNCASIGCPALRNEAYTADRLNEQLESQTIGFLSDKTRNYLKGNSLYLTPLFKWYRDDFTDNAMGYKSVEAFIAKYRTAITQNDNQARKTLEALLKKGSIDIEYTPYNWDLNAKR